MVLSNSGGREAAVCLHRVVGRLKLVELFIVRPVAVASEPEMSTTGRAAFYVAYLNMILALRCNTVVEFAFIRAPVFGLLSVAKAGRFHAVRSASCFELRGV